MPQFKETAPSFYQQYFNARMIIDLGIRHNIPEEEELEDINE